MKDLCNEAVVSFVAKIFSFNIVLVWHRKLNVSF